jgi:hypothetical protein
MAEEQGIAEEFSTQKWQRFRACVKREDLHRQIKPWNRGETRPMACGSVWES